MRGVLITGGCGFTGIHLARLFIGRGWAVSLFDVNAPTADVDSGCTYIQGDVRDARSVREAMSACDVVIHNAALVPLTGADRLRLESVNVHGTATVLAEARRRNAYTVHISSSAVFGVPAELPVVPNTPFRPFEDYGASKAEAERRVLIERTRGLRVGVIRPRTLVGLERLGLFEIIFAQIRSGKRVPLFGSGNNLFQLLDVEDFCTAVLAAVDHDANDDFNVGAAEYGTVRTDLQALIDHAGTGSRLLSLPAAPARAALRILAALNLSPFAPWNWGSAAAPFYFDLEKTEQELGWKPRRSNIEALTHAYDNYLRAPEATGESVHRQPLRGMLASAMRGRRSHGGRK